MSALYITVSATTGFAFPRAPPRRRRDSAGGCDGGCDGDHNQSINVIGVSQPPRRGIHEGLISDSAWFSRGYRARMASRFSTLLFLFFGSSLVISVILSATLTLGCYSRLCCCLINHQPTLQQALANTSLSSRTLSEQQPVSLSSLSTPASSYSAVGDDGKAAFPTF